LAASSFSRRIAREFAILEQNSYLWGMQKISSFACRHGPPCRQARSNFMRSNSTARLRLEREGDRVRLITKGGQDWARRFPRSCGADEPADELRHWRSHHPRRRRLFRFQRAGEIWPRPIPQGLRIRTGGPGIKARQSALSRRQVARPDGACRSDLRGP
jgi:hypothetical protein